jgi:predicted amidohydrolase
MTVVSIALLEAQALSGDLGARRQQLAAAIAAAPECDLLVLPYLPAYPPFWREIDRAAGFANGERAPFPSLVHLREVVNARGVPLLSPVFEVVAEGVFYATAVLLRTDGAQETIYRQEHALNQPGCRERLYFQPGMNDEPAIIPLGGIRLGVLLGGDLWVPEAARLLRLRGANALLEITGIDGGAFGEVRSIENGIPVFVSGSAIAAFGADRQLRHEHWTLIEVDPARIAADLAHHDPLQMRRPRLYSELSATWEGDAG